MSTATVAPTNEQRRDTGVAGRRFRRPWLRVLTFVGFFAAWELFGRSVSEVLLAPPSKIVLAFADLVATGEIPYAIWASSHSFSVGFLLAAAIGITAGLAIGWSKRLAFVFEPLVNGMYATPLVSLVPLVMLWFGMGFRGKVFFIAMVALFPILINTLTGVRNVEGALLEVGRSFKASRRALFTEIVVPSALPYMMTGLRLGIGRAVVGMVLAEMYLAFEGGIGHLIVAYGSSFATSYLFAIIMILPLLGMGLSKLVYVLEAKLTPWNESPHDT